VLAKIHYAIYGQGSPVVFLHGGLMPLASASPPRSVAIGAGVGGKVSHRSAAKGQRYTGDERGEGELAHELLRKETIQRLYTALSAAGINLGAARE
jgi:hypothetical protein